MVTDEAIAEYESILREYLASIIEITRQAKETKIDERIALWVEKHRPTTRELIELTSRIILRALPEELKYLAPSILAGFVGSFRDPGFSDMQ